VLQSAADHYRQQQTLTAVTIAAAVRLWSRLGPGDFDEAWRVLGPQLQALLMAAQIRAADDAARYVAAAALEQGLDPLAVGELVPAAFGSGYASDGRPLATLLYQPLVATRTSLGQGSSLADALSVGQQALSLIVGTQTADAGRAAESVAIASTPSVGGWVRMLNPPSCSRCVILAGKWFRWNQGFARHPRCDCRHIPASENHAGDLTTDPYEYFQGLSRPRQDAAFGAANAQAIRDGADIYQVVNASRTSAGLTTLEGVRSRRGYAARELLGPIPRAAVPRVTRLTPQGIYDQASSREEALALLRRNGYITGKGQLPGGAIQGPIRPGREGFGQMGRGGTRVAARDSVERARRTGVRDPNNRATMTAAERRAFDDTTGRARMTTAQRAEFDRAVRAGVDPGLASRRVLGEQTAHEAAQSAVAQARKVEPSLTRSINRLAERHGARVEGLDFRIKGVDSLARKIQDDMDRFRVTAGQAAADVSDINRYTLVLPASRYSAGAQAAIDDLRASGATVRVKNYWAVPSNPYQGVNCVVTLRDGTRYELQFHTPDSLRIKEHELHGLYEQRRASRDAALRARLNQEMFQVAAGIPVPASVDRIH